MEIINGKEFQRRASAAFKKQYEEAKEIELEYPEQEFIPEMLAKELKGWSAFEGEMPPIISRRTPNEKDKAAIGQIWVHGNRGWNTKFFKCQEYRPDLNEYIWNRIVTPRDAGKALKKFGHDAASEDDKKTFRDRPLSEWDQAIYEQNQELYYKKEREKYKK